MQESFNILYLLNQIYQPLSGVSISGSTLQSGGFVALQYIEWGAMGLSVIFLLGFIWSHLQLAVVEERMHHRRLELEIEVAEKAKGATNPLNARFSQILALANSSSESDWRRAIIEADSMLADMLSERGFVGADVGEQLRSASRTRFATLDLAGRAHGMRNSVAHTAEDFVLTNRDTLATIDMYRRVFEEFNYI